MPATSRCNSGLSHQFYNLSAWRNVKTPQLNGLVLTRKPVMTGRLTGCVRGILAPDMVAGSNPAALFTLTTSERMTKPKGNSQLTITRLQ